MFEARFEVKSITDLMFGQHVASPKRDNETHEEHERRTWREKVPVTDDGQCYLNPFAVTNSLVEAGAWLKRKIPGEGNATYTKRFLSGVAPGERVLLFKHDRSPLMIDDLHAISLFVPSDGKHGGPKRVDRIFPTAHEWIAKGSLYVFDGKISLDQFRDHLECVGKFIGWGSMRVGNGGINGRFVIIEVSEHALQEVA